MSSTDAAALLGIWFLLARQEDEAWERRLASPELLPGLEKFLHDSAAEGDDPLDPNRR
jgi:hypothetical protein